MKKVQVLPQKLKNYSAAAALVIIGGNVLKGQIVYSDINPDTIISISNSFYSLDLENDGNIDFVFEVTQSSTTTPNYSLLIKRVAVSPYQTGFAVAATTSGPYNYPIALNLNSGIGPNLTWNTATNQSVASVWFTNGSSPSYFGNFLGAVDKFMAFKFLQNGFTHYGWARVDVTSFADTMVIKDFAFNSNANGGLLTGDQTGTAVNDLQKLPAYIFCNDNNLTIDLNHEFVGNTQLIISNPEGQVVLSKPLSQSKTQILLNDLPSSVYLIQLICSNDIIGIKKIVLTH